MTSREKIQLMNEVELSNLIKRSVQTLRNERFRGAGIPYVKIGRSVRYRLSDVEQFIEKNLILCQKRKKRG